MFKQDIEVKGVVYKYTNEVEEEEDVRKIWHTVFNPLTNESVHMDWTPYGNPTTDEISLWIELGMPDRSDMGRCGPIHSEDLAKYADNCCMSMDAWKSQQGELFNKCGDYSE